MAGETVVLSASEISQLIQYASAFIVAVISGLAVSLGWVKAKHLKPEDVASTPAPPVNGNEAVAQLSRAIQLLIDRLIEMHEDSARKEKREREVIEELSEDIRRLIHFLRSALTEKG